MKIGITGVNGFVGSRLAAIASEGGHEVVGFSRSPSGSQRLFSSHQPPDASGLDAIVHLAGEPILGLWTATKKQRIRSSRVEGTRRLVEGITLAKDKPRVLISASAIGFYGETGEATADESTPCGSGFLAEVAQDWETEAIAAESLGVRVVRLRIGFVIGRGGAMKLMLPAFRLGGGGKIGSGHQWMSGVHVDDVAGLALMAAGSDSLSGPVNAVLPEPVRNADFTRALAKAVRRPAVIPAPAWMLRFALGELSHVLLDSLRVVPGVAREAGYQWRFPTLEAALREVTGT
ncbi:MAG: hypothetical protein Fur0032_18830 [Terrimicrobiaceae bacterium]